MPTRALPRWPKGVGQFESPDVRRSEPDLQLCAEDREKMGRRVSGQTGVDPATGRLVKGDVAAQAEQIFKNLAGVLAVAGLSLGDAVKCNVYLTDIGDFQAMNAVYARQFEAPYPARTTVAVAALPGGARIEIELVARQPA
jgi:2-iminobutanoate/2-iminopropanoate deaminase